MAERAIASTNFPQIFLNVTKVAKILDVVRGNETCLKFGYRTIRQFPHTHTHKFSFILYKFLPRCAPQEAKEAKKERGENGGFSFFSFLLPNRSKSFISSLLRSTFIETNLSLRILRTVPVQLDAHPRENTYYSA